MTMDEKTNRHRDTARAIADTGVVLTEGEIAAIEVVDFGLGDFEREGLGIVVYVNTDRYCAKELVMLPGQACPQHRHPPVGEDPGKTETFRCRRGVCYLFLDGPATPDPQVAPPDGKAAVYTAARQIVLRPGEQFTIPPDTWHWFRAGPEGAIVSEFSSTSRDEADVFADPAVRRVET